MNDNTHLTKTQDPELLDSPKLLMNDISQLIEEARSHVAREYNSAHVQLCWLIGKRIDDEVLKSQRAEYGEGLIDAISENLSSRYGRGYGRRNLFRMLKFSRYFPDKQIVYTLSTQLSWSHFILISAIDKEA
jgi:hypothetical protein